MSRTNFGRADLRRYRPAGLLLLVITLISMWPPILAPLARAYVRFCARYLAESPLAQHPPPYVIAAIIPAFAALMLTVALLLARQFVGQRQLVADSERRQRPVDAHAEALAAATGLDQRLVVRDAGETDAFCAGLFVPKVYLSAGLLTILSRDELEAVLRHEAHHLQRRDPLRLLIMHVFSVLASPFPACRTLIERVRIGVEVAADQAALEAVPLEVLASALVKAARATTPSRMVAATARLTPSQSRIAALLGHSVMPPIERRDVIVTALVLLALTGALVNLALLPFPMSSLCDVCPPF